MYKRKKQTEEATWNDKVYASVKVTVTGDFNDKQV